MSQGLSLIETLRWTPDEGFWLLAQHLRRLQRSVDALGWTWDRAAIEAALARAVDQSRQMLRVRLELDQHGQIKVKGAVLDLSQHRRWRIVLSPHVLQSDDPWLRHKSTRRGRYDADRAALCGRDKADEVIYVNEKAELCEGAITNIFIGRALGPLLTPPVSCGLLPGVLREQLLSEGRAVEEYIGLDDLKTAGSIYVGNSVRGLIEAVFDDASM